MIRILIVDDSPTEVSIIKHIIEPEKDMEVIGVAANGKEAVEMTAKLKPDLITMDIQMPIMNGLEATRQIMSQNPTPIVVISSTVSDESIKATFHILEAGALTALAKPVNILSPSFEETRKYIVDSLRSLSEVSVHRKSLKTPIRHAAAVQTTQNYEIVAIGASVGGPLALKEILSKLPADFPVPIVVVQHMSSGFIEGFVRWLSESTALKVKTAENFEFLQKGTVYIAAENRHLEIARNGGKLIAKCVDPTPPAGFCPSINVLLKSVAAVCGKNAIGILLTGMSDDGATGLLVLKKAKGLTLIQDKESAVVFGMAHVAQAIGGVDEVVELDRIGPYLIKLATQR